MQISLTEPTSPRYLYINPKTNRVHVLMPIVSGTQIGLDNTCKSVFAMQDFFGKSNDAQKKPVLDELKRYQKALEFDIGLIDEGMELRRKKQKRLWQIKQYISAIEAMIQSPVLNALSLALPAYPEAVQARMMQPESNISSMVLRPTAMDSYLRFVNPVFQMNRTGQSVFYDTIINAYQGVSPLPGAKERLKAGVLAALAGQAHDFATLQRVLAEQVHQQLNLTVDFTRTKAGERVTKEYLDNLMGYDASTPATVDEYIKDLLSACALNLFDTLVESPFYTRKNAEELSIITQFFMASVNIYCHNRGLSTANFAQTLDNAEGLSDDIAGIVLFIEKGASIEEALLNWVNTNYHALGLSKELSPVDKAHIKKQFTAHYAQIKESPHFDEFMVLDDSKDGPFVSHQGSVCLDFAELLHSGSQQEQLYFESIREDFKTLKKEDITHQNPSVHATVELRIEELLAKITDDDQLQAVLKRLPSEQRDEILASPQIKRMQVPKFLLHVARGERNKANSLLNNNPDAQLLLQTPGTFTDYSGRTFSNCTAYEYAYWAKDTHMQRMLEKHMDEETKAKMLERVDAIEANGLTYTQHGEIKNSKHFDFTPLKTALQEFVNGYDAWYAAGNWVAMKAAWMKLGKAQRDLPVHVANEYCRKDRSFDPLPAFNEASLPEELTFYNFETDRDELWFPLSDSPSSGLGVDCAVGRGRGDARGRGRGLAAGTWVFVAVVDLAAVSRLDEVRTDDLTQSRENLKPMAQESGLAMT